MSGGGGGLADEGGVVVVDNARLLDISGLLASHDAHSTGASTAATLPATLDHTNHDAAWAPLVPFALLATLVAFVLTERELARRQYAPQATPLQWWLLGLVAGVWCGACALAGGDDPSCAWCGGPALALVVDAVASTVPPPHLLSATVSALATAAVVAGSKQRNERTNALVAAAVAVVLFAACAVALRVVSRPSPALARLSVCAPLSVVWFAAVFVVDATRHGSSTARRPWSQFALHFGLAVRRTLAVAPEAALLCLLLWTVAGTARTLPALELVCVVGGARAYGIAKLRVGRTWGGRRRDAALQFDEFPMFK